MTETLLLCSLLSSPVYAVRDAATNALSARPDALPVLTALQAHGDPETRLRCEIAVGRVRVVESRRVLTGPAPLSDAEARDWAGRYEALEDAAHRDGYLPENYPAPAVRVESVGGSYRTVGPDVASVRQLVGWCRNQAAFPPGHPMRWPWNGTSWQFCSTGWKW